MLSRRGILASAICGALLPCGCAGSGAANSRAAGAIIDVHAHVQVGKYLALLARVGVRRPGLQPFAPARTGPSPAGDDEAATTLRVALMEEAGVGAQVLSPTLAPYLDDDEIAVAAARLVNDAHARLMARHPGRLASYVSLPLPHIEASLAEMRRGLDQLGMAGVTLQSACLGRSIAEDQFQPLFEEMNRRRATLFVHPAVDGLASPLINDWRLTAAVGPLLEDAVIALHFMVKAIPARFPDIKIIVPHLGGGLATMLERLDNQLPLSVADLPERPSATARRFWYDTVSHGSPAALRAAAEAFGAKRLVAGSDFPVLLSFERYGDTFAYVRRALARDDAERVLHANAADLFAL